MKIAEAAALLRRQDNILILTHKRPDGDTVGCAAALCAALRQIGKTAYVLPNPELTATCVRLSVAGTISFACALSGLAREKSGLPFSRLNLI